MGTFALLGGQKRAGGQTKKGGRRAENLKKGRRAN